MNQDKLKQLQIDRGQKRRSPTMLWVIFSVVLLVSGGAIFLAIPRTEDSVRKLKSGNAAAMTGAKEAATAGNLSPTNRIPPTTAAPTATGSVLTVSGYIVNHARIEISPRFMGVVKWIGVKKGDTVTNGQVIVLLDDAEYRARLHETEGRLAVGRVAEARAQLDFDRAHALVGNGIEMQKAEDDARLQLESARAAIKEIEGQVELNKTYLDWTVIKSPINGVVLEKLVDPDELVTPQSFGGTRGPSTALVAMADPQDLQVEIDLNESDLSKVYPKQKCRVSPEAYLDRTYDGYVAEIAPEANRQKGTLQIKVQILNPDKFLTPELSAKVDFLK